MNLKTNDATNSTRAAQPEASSSSRKTLAVKIGVVRKNNGARWLLLRFSHLQICTLVNKFAVYKIFSFLLLLFY